MVCEKFACTRFESCPADVGQRIADGLGSALALLGTECGEFDFSRLVEHNDPLYHLPVLFSSLRYKSPTLEETIYPKIAVPGIEEYWFGLGGFGINTLCARAGSSTYYYHANTWVLWTLGPGISTFKSVPGVTLSSVQQTTTSPTCYLGVRELGPPESDVDLGLLLGVTNCQVSGNGLTYFARDSSGWKRYVSTSWESVGFGGTNLWLVPSFDGHSFVLTNLDSPSTFYYKIESANIRSKTTSGSGAVYAAVLGTTVFVVRGSKIYTVGSLNVLSLIKTLESGAATGIWADDVSVWVSTTTGTYMSNDAGWTWIVLTNKFAVGPGLFTSLGSANIWMNSDETFAEVADMFPLRLTNGGLLSSPQNGWRHSYEDTTANTLSTTISATTAAALSPNGLYLLTNDNGVITLYLNAWNSPKIIAWCRGYGNNCKPGYAKYCQAFGSIDTGCINDTPGGPTPSPSPTPVIPATNYFPSWGIALIVLGVVALVIGVIYVVSKKKKTSKNPIKNP